MVSIVQEILEGKIAADYGAYKADAAK